MSMPMKTKKRKIRIDNSNYKRGFERFLRSKMKNPKFGILTPEKEREIKGYHIYYNGSQRIYRYNNAFVIGLNSPAATKGTPDDIYHNIRVKLAELVGLTRCTNRILLQRFAIQKQTQFSNKLSEYIKDLFFILETLRTNTIVKTLDNYLRFNMKHVFVLEMNHTAKRVKETLKYVGNDLTNVEKLNIIRDVMYFMASSVMTENPMVLETENKEMNQITRTLFPFVMYAPEASDTQTVINMTEKIITMMDHILYGAKKELQEMDEKMESLFGFGEVGTYNPIYQDVEESQLDPTIKEKMAEMFDEKKRKKGHKHHVKEKIDMSQNQNKDEEYVDYMSEKDFGDIIDRSVKDIASKLDEYADNESGSVGSSDPYEKQYRPSVTAQMMEEYFHGIKKSTYQVRQERDEDLRIQNLFVEILTPLHEGCKAYFKERSRYDTFDEIEYKSNVHVVQPFINQIVRAIRALVQQAQIQSSDYEQSGELDPNKLFDYVISGDKNIFKQQEIEILQMILEVMILVDNSGSQEDEVFNPQNNVSQPRYKYNQMYTIMLHEAFKKLGFPHSVWTFYEGSNKKQQMASIIHRENCFHKDAGLYIAEIGAHGCNRDGFAIRYAGNYLNRTSRSKNRLMIVISDGQPNGKGYKGHTAMQDVYDAVKEVEQGGATVIGIFTGKEEENEYFKTMYEKREFANNESITTLPKKLKDILVREYRDKVNNQI